MRNFFHFLLWVAVIALAACRQQTSPDAEVSLQPVPFVLSVPSHIASNLSCGPVDGPFGDMVTNDGALAATTVYYTPVGGERIIFMTAFYFPADKFDSLQKPNEPPLYGSEVARINGNVLSVAGPLDAMFAADSPDGRNLEALYGRIYLQASYRELK